MDWIDLKTALTESSGLSRDALHIFAGIGLHSALVLAFRSWFGAVWPLAIILAFAFGNEWIDLASETWVGALDRQYLESAKDLATTLAAPVLLMLLARFAPGRFRRQPRSE